MVGGIPICVQCGTESNPCGCKVVEWQLGPVVYLFRHVKGRRIMAHPANVVYPKVNTAIPI